MRDVRTKDVRTLLKGGQVMWGTRMLMIRGPLMETTERIRENEMASIKCLTKTGSKLWRSLNIEMCTLKTFFGAHSRDYINICWSVGRSVSLSVHNTVESRISYQEFLSHF